MRNPQARIRLFCFPYAGGGATIFRSWPEYLPAEIEVCPVRLPGRESRLLEQPISHLPSLISVLASGLFPYLDKPYAFFGHSMGALIAFELASYLRHCASRNEPLHLFVSGHRAPQLPDPNEPVYHLPEAELIERLRHLQGTPEEFLNNQELLRLFMPMLRADFTLCETYVYQQTPAFPYPITALGGLQDPVVSRESILSWEAQTSSTFNACFFDGCVLPVVCLGSQGGFSFSLPPSSQIQS